MAYYAALISLLKTLDQIPQHVEQITSLQEKASRLLMILEDFSQKSSLKIKDLEGKIRDAAYQAEDIIERSAEVHGLEMIIDEFDSILEAVSNKIEDEKIEDPQPKNFPSAGSSRFPASNDSTLVGVDEDLMRIKDRLTGSRSRLDIIPIVGMGGIGKTTLARNLYNDKLIEYHFDTRAWTVVSQEYHVQEMLTDLLHTTRHGGGELHQKSVQQLSEVLYKNLKGRRYLIVMDDVWDTKAWDEVRRFFPDDNNGSRIILTTRISEVALYAHANSSIHHMSLLGSDASWNLLREKTFGEECCPSELEEIGKRIAENCKGLPLAIIVIGGLLSKGSRTIDYWEYIAENVKLAVMGNDDQLMEILSLSYNSLPHHLKACFLYMGVFPEDHVIFASQLIKLWIAEGFIKPKTCKSLEELAEGYLKDLLDRNLVLVHKKRYNGEIKSCMIHDLLRELCVKIAHDEKFFQIINRGDHVSTVSKNHNPRRVSIHSYILRDLHDSCTRSLLCFCGCRSNDRFLSFIKSCSRLNVLDALTIRFYKFPIQILELVHLRYVAFIYNGKCMFPASISKLRNLQTLIIFRGSIYKLIRKSWTLHLPPTIWEMPQLRHLLLDEILLPDPSPAQITGKGCVILKDLQTLSGVRNFKCTREVFALMPTLKKLGISYFYDTDTEWSSFEFNNFVYLHQLETLKCLFFARSNQSNSPLLVNFAFPPNLRKLTLSGCRISWEKMTIVGSLPNLEVLKLKDYAFEGSVWEPKEGEFSRLKFLIIESSNLEHWRANSTHFPRLLL